VVFIQLGFNATGTDDADEPDCDEKQRSRNPWLLLVLMLKLFYLLSWFSIVHDFITRSWSDVLVFTAYDFQLEAIPFSRAMP